MYVCMHVCTCTHSNHKKKPAYKPHFFCQKVCSKSGVSLICRKIAIGYRLSDDINRPDISSLEIKVFVIQGL